MYKYGDDDDEMPLCGWYINHNDELEYCSWCSKGVYENLT
jgi:hypothetical protein